MHVQKKKHGRTLTKVIIILFGLNKLVEIMVCAIQQNLKKTSQATAELIRQNLARDKADASLLAENAWVRHLQHCPVQQDKDQEEMHDQLENAGLEARIRLPRVISL